MPPTLSKIGEFGLIDYIRKHAPQGDSVIKGIGDDTAVLEVGSKGWLLFTTDMIIEGVHFFKDTAPEAVGRKALACNISDIASMGGVPTFAVISLGAPDHTDVRKIKKIFSGIRKLAQEFAISIVGGDTVKSDRLVITIALLGKVFKKQFVSRSGARVGDIIFTTGRLGLSLQTQKHLFFTPRVKEARYLMKYFKPSAMIDISDGLAADLGHILTESRVGALLYESQIPLSPKARLQNALYDGEDFELVFTLSRPNARKLNALRKCPFVFSEIGQIVKQQYKLQLRDDLGKKRLVEVKGFEHF